MARYIIVGEQGTDDLLVVDKQAMTVSKIDATGPGQFRNDGSLDTVQAMRGGGMNIVKGVSVAVAVEDHQDPSARWVYQQA